MAPNHRSLTLQARRKAARAKPKLQVQHPVQSRRSTRVVQLNDPRPTLLHGLPPEIQEMLLSHLCGGMCVKNKHGNVEIGAVFFRSDDGGVWDPGSERLPWKPRGFKALQPGLPGWMLVNKQIYVAALQHFHRHAELSHIRDLVGPVRHKPIASVDHFALDRARIVNLNQWENCYLNTSIQVYWEYFLRHTDYCLDLTPEDELPIENVANHLVPSTAMEQLTLRFGLSIRDYVPFLQPIDRVEFRFPFLSMLPKGLHKVTLLMALPYRSTAYNFEIAKDTIKSELRDLALSLVQSGSKCEEETVYVAHGMKLDSRIDLSKKRPVWRVTAISPEYQRARNFGRAVLHE